MMKRTLQTVCVTLLSFVVAVSAIVPAHSRANDASAEQKKARKKNAGKKKQANQGNAAAKRRAAQLRKKRQQQLKRKAQAKRKQSRRKNPANRPGKNAANKKTASNKKPATKKASAEKGLTADVLTWEETRKFIAKQKGKIVVIDFWATWCAPCVKELPNIEALQKRYPKDVVTITFNTDNAGLKDDPLSKIQPRIVAYLKKKNIDAAKHIVSKDTDEKLYQAAKFESVPTIFVYDRQGKLAGKLDVEAAGGKDVTYKDHVNPLVDKLVKQK